jgi:hypothetical protein
MSSDDARRQFEADEWQRARSWYPGSLPPLDDADPTAALVRELQAVGVPLRSLGEFANTNLTYPASVPILIRHLGKVYPNDINTTILQILSRLGSDEVVHRALIAALREQCRDASDDTLFAFGDAIAETAPKRSIDALLEIAATRHYRTARMSPMLKIARTNDPRVRPMIANYLQEKDLNPWLALRVLRLAKMWDHADWVEPYLSSTNDYYRPEARKYQRAFEKATETLSS